MPSVVPSDPLVSIITPSLNQGQFIEQTLRCIANQSYKNVEHIVVDGGSTDDTPEILETYRQSQNVKYIRERDRSMYDGINKGLRMSKGQIQAYLNTDDLYLPWTVETVVDAFSRDTGVKFVYGDVLVLEEDDPGVATCVIRPPHMMASILTGRIVPQLTMFWRSEVAEGLGGFDETLQVCGDVEFGCRAASSFRGRKIHEVLAIDRRHSKGKRFVLGSLLDDERDRILGRYRRGASGAPRRLAFAVQYAMWRRALEMLFVGQIVAARNGMSTAGRLWGHFVQTPGLEFARDPRRLFLGWLPFLGRRGYRPKIRGFEALLPGSDGAGVR